MRDESRVQCGDPVAKETPKAAHAVLVWVFPGRKWYSSRAPLCGWEVSEKWLSLDIRRADCANRPSLLPTSNGKNDNINSNYWRLRSARDNDRRSKRFCYNAALCASFTWQMVKTCVIRWRMIGPNARDQIAFNAFHSFLGGIAFQKTHSELHTLRSRSWNSDQETFRIWLDR